MFSISVLLITFFVAGLLESRRVPDWEAVLMQYLDVSGIQRQGLRFVWVAEAQRLDQFSAEALVPVPANWTWEDIVQIPPPERLRCIRLEYQTEVEGSALIQDYLLIGYHNDELWHVGWLVYEFREGVSAEQAQARFAQMGCGHWEQLLQ